MGTVAVRAAELLAYFETSLETDLISLIESTVYDKDINNYAKYLVRHLSHYRKELRNYEMSIEEIRTYLQRKSNKFSEFVRHRISKVNNKSFNILCFILNKKMILLDTY